MSQIRKHTSASSPDIRNINVDSTNPLSDISNVDIRNVDKDEAAKRRKARRLYLNSKRSKKSHHRLNRQSSFSVLSSINVSSSSSKFNSGNCPSSSVVIKDITSLSPSNFTNPDYLDHGDQIIVCGSCNAKIWKAEADRGEKKRNKVNYSICCSYGKVLLPDLRQPPDILKDLYVGANAKSNFFQKYIRRYNSMFSFTSMGGRIDKSINRGNALYIFRLSGQNYHNIGNMLPNDGDAPKFSQLYIYDTDNEIFNRQNVVGGSNTSFSITENAFDVQIIEELKVMLDTHNALLRLIGKRSKDGRTYNLPEASEVAALVIGDFTQAVENRDIVVKTKSGRLERISELHSSYLSLQYPLLFPYGEDMYRVDILHRGLNLDTKSKRPMCTMREFFAYRLQDRVDKFSVIHNAKRLFQQFVVDAYTMIESERLFYIRRQQTHLRSESFQNIQNANNSGKKDMYPDFFITITCNPKWPEVERFLKDTTIRPEDRLDILCRIFKIKLDSITKDLKEGNLLGRVNSVVYTVEFQKRGVPHVHICVFMHPDSKILSVDQLDPIISAEIPDIAEDPELYKLVADYMIHGPCGAFNMNYPCMIDRPDRTTLRVVESGNHDEEEPVVDEIEKYYDCRYISACETAWRIFSYDIHYRYPAVIRLPFHLPSQQNVVYGANDDIDEVLNKPFVASTMFLSWMKCNERLPMARDFTYVEFPSKDACYSLGLLDDENEYVEVIKEANVYGSATYLRTLFGTMLMFDLHYSDEEIKNLALLEIEKFLLHNNSSLRNYSNMPYPDDESISSSNNRLINEELCYDQNTMEDELNSMLVLLTDEQRNVFDQIIESVRKNKGVVFFLYGYGGTGKTFLWKTLSAAIRSKSEIVLNVASSGIASLLLSGGRTTHSRFSIPLNK
ncbi:uncharacterized protein LOC110931558 [Helianthus annuus]|uniref:uncharacterized protein LOC110931558 n=1 Tax=Helianthus annuus TaxID=4232 RepID=UPI001652D61E|nr:uncharacterized protein LOC110931558 [Helianthus annuus]